MNRIAARQLRVLERIDAIQAQKAAAAVSPYTVQVIADQYDAWTSNGRTFETTAAAVVYANDLAWRWSAVRAWRVVDQNGVTFESRRFGNAN